MDADVPVPSFPCGWCSREFTSMAELNKHQSRTCKEPTATNKRAFDQVEPARANAVVNLDGVAPRAG